MKEETEYCEWCGSSKHQSDECPTLNLVKALTGKPFHETNMPDLVVITDDKGLERSIEEAHMLQHLFKDGKASIKNGGDGKP